MGGGRTRAFHDVIHGAVADGRVARFDVHERLVADSHRDHLLHPQLCEEQEDVRTFCRSVSPDDILSLSSRGRSLSHRQKQAALTYSIVSDVILYSIDNKNTATNHITLPLRFRPRPLKLTSTLRV